jgi:hypothetical protein
MLDSNALLGEGLKAVYMGTPYSSYMQQVEKILEKGNLIKNKNELMIGNIERYVGSVTKAIGEFRASYKE